MARNARQGLPLLAGRFFSTGRKAATQGTPARDLHRFRIAAKHFRYTLEFFGGIYGPRLDDLISEVRQIQTYLGERNDCAATLRLLPKKGYDGLRTTLNARAEEQERLFRAYWQDHFADDEVCRRWIHYLAAYPGRKGRPAAS
ncbi:MAG: CHAD domain-containing protein [Acidobacteria bacterium]|nr:CHAD domain-containing protein [Acidobacteriota bacterium]